MLQDTISTFEFVRQRGIIADPEVWVRDCIVRART